mmetsp:Transcript_16853/g.38058  ORF Transcript_16853/g.38058 Transcript_16853/m.38058 type:complete len:150 (+) Transcript_16853:61-510(+)|eukprot:CAMPEP_0197914682 /NCGR_PEP_ID=MMETSP1439-20131203/78930_1 /TAXON_ID=66791 /ORGANISM="Gonyaulax spinifera, Strain CCMP409" /LENGTH=149 /DNA_ID=CAMNT_0043536605 /DNA_START=56 /DNA_END=505 /DNA_ORIENTATION=+
MTETRFQILERVAISPGIEVIQISRGMYHLLDLISTVILFVLPFFMLTGLAFTVTFGATVLHNLSHAVTDFGDTTPWLQGSTAKRLPLKSHVIVDFLYGTVVFWMAWVFEAPGDSNPIGQLVYKVLSLLVLVSTPLLVARLFEHHVSTN